MINKIIDSNSLQYKQSQNRLQRKKISHIVVYYNILNFPTRKPHGR